MVKAIGVSRPDSGVFPKTYRVRNRSSKNRFSLELTESKNNTDLANDCREKSTSYKKNLSIILVRTVTVER